MDRVRRIMCDAYNRWLGDVLDGQERLKWVGVANLDEIPASVRQVKEAKKLGAVGMPMHQFGYLAIVFDFNDDLLAFYDAQQRSWRAAVVTDCLYGLLG